MKKELEKKLNYTDFIFLVDKHIKAGYSKKDAKNLVTKMVKEMK